MTPSSLQSQAELTTLPVTPKQQKTFFDNAKASLDAPLFAAYLPYQASGSYDFGYIDASKHSGTIRKSIPRLNLQSAD